MKKNFFAFIIFLVLCVSAQAQTDGFQRLKSGFGTRNYSATSTAQLYTLQEHVLPSIIVNGDFATNTVWETGGDWTIGGGKATNAAAAPGVSALVNDISTADPRLRYDVVYTLAAFTNGDSVVTSIGKQSWPANTSAGTYTNTFDIRESTDLTFTATTTNATSALTLDDVTVRPIRQDAYLYRATFANASTGSIYLAFNTDLAKFAEFAGVTSIELKNGESVNFIGDHDQMYQLKNFAYSSPAGTTNTLEAQGF